MEGRKRGGGKKERWREEREVGEGLGEVEGPEPVHTYWLWSGTYAGIRNNWYQEQTLVTSIASSLTTDI